MKRGTKVKIRALILCGLIAAIVFGSVAVHKLILILLVIAIDYEIAYVDFLYATRNPSEFQAQLEALKQQHAKERRNDGSTDIDRIA